MRKLYKLWVGLLLLLLLPAIASGSSTSSYQTSTSTDNGASWDLNYTGKTYVLWQTPQIIFKLKGFKVWDDYAWNASTWFHPYNVALEVDGIQVYNAGGIFSSPVTEGQWVMNTAQYAEGAHNVKATYYHDFAYGWRESYDYSTVNLAGPATKPKKATTVGISSKPKKIARGKAVVIKGRLKDVDGNVLAGKIIKIKAGNKTVKTLKTQATGFYKLKTKPKKTKVFQAFFEGDNDYTASSSKAIRVTVH